MEIRQMIYFKELAEQLNLPAVAGTLYITPQALSKSMRNLAKEFDTEIFYRERSQLQLTTFGKALYQETTRLLKQVHEMEDRLKNVASQEQGTLRLALSHGIMQGNIQHFFDEFQKEHPQITLDLIELPDIFAEQYVAQEECDLGLAIGMPDEQDIFDSVLLQHYQVCAVVHPAHPVAKQTTTSLKDCCLYPLITKNRIFKIHDIVENCARKQNLHLFYALQSPNEVMWRILIEENRGVGIGTMYYNNSEHASSLVSVPFVEPQLSWDIVLIKKKNHYLSRLAVTLIDALLLHCKTVEVSSHFYGKFSE